MPVKEKKPISILKNQINKNNKTFFFFKGESLNTTSHKKELGAPWKKWMLSGFQG
jgi:hypothetical protein